MQRKAMENRCFYVAENQVNMLLLGQYIFINPSCTDLSAAKQRDKANATNATFFGVHFLFEEAYLAGEQKMLWCTVIKYGGMTHQYF